jgi:hypothetical protein
MKNSIFRISVISTMTILLMGCAINNAKFFSNTEPSTDATYGYTEKNPITIKNADLSNSINSCYYYLSRLRTSDNQKLLLIQRYSIDNPDFREPAITLQNRYTGQILNNGTGPLLDLYILTPEDKSDTIKLYINPYLKSQIKIPMGLKFEK